MPPRKRTKTLALRRAVSLNEFRDTVDGAAPSTLQQVIERLHRRPGRRVQINGRTVECRAAQRLSQGWLGLYFVGFTPQDPVAIIQHAQPAMGLASPPEDTDFLDGELMILVAGSDVVVCRCGLPESIVSYYVESLAPEADLLSENVAFALKKRADVEKLALIEDEGVLRISLNAVAGSAALSEALSPREQIGTGVWREVKALLGIETAREYRPLEDLFAQVSIKFDKRIGGRPEQTKITDIARILIENEDDDGGFMIETLTHRKLRGDDVVISKRVGLTDFGKTVAFSEALAEMAAFYGELSEEGTT